MAGKDIQEVFCCRLQIGRCGLTDISKSVEGKEGSRKEPRKRAENCSEKKLNIFLASTCEKEALRIGMSFDDTLDCVSYFRPIFHKNKIVEDRIPNRPLIQGVDAALHNQPLPFQIRYGFTLTGFMESVLNAIRSIPFGTTRTYKEIGRLLGRPTSARAIGQALKNNPLPIIFP